MTTDRTGPRPRPPVRTCVGCRRTDSWSALLRVVAVVGQHGDVVLVSDPRHRLPGRGAWLHPSTTCFEQAVRRKAFIRALRLQTGPDVTALARDLADRLPEQHHPASPEQPAQPAQPGQPDDS